MKKIPAGEPDEKKKTMVPIVRWCPLYGLGLLAALAAIFALPHTTEAAVERIGSYTTIQSSDEAPQSNDVTVPADAEIMMVIVSGFEFVADTLESGSFTLAGNAMNIGVDGDDSTSFHMGMIFYYDVSNLDGTRALAWDLPGAATITAGINVSYAFYKGINTSSPIRSSGGVQANTGSLTTGSLTAISGDMIVAGLAYTSNVTSITWTNVTEVIAPSFNNSTLSVAEAAPTGNTTVSATLNDGDPDGSVMGVVLAQAEAVSIVRTIRLRGAVRIFGGTHL